MCTISVTERPLAYLHLFQRVAHVGVSVGEVGRYGNSLLVVHQSLMQLALLLEHASQV